MQEWICLKCNSVFLSESPKCCGGPFEHFDPSKHGARLVSNSNSWISIWGKWRDNKLFNEVSTELINDGCYSAAAMLNEFITRLIERAYESEE